MACTANDNRRLWQGMAARYESYAERQPTEAAKAHWLKKADEARAHSFTYKD